MSFINNLRNRLLTGHEVHPYSKGVTVCRRDIQPGLIVETKVHLQITDGLPDIWKDSQILDAIQSPEKYQWFGHGYTGIGRVKYFTLVFTSTAYQRAGQWFALATTKDVAGPTELSLWELGIVPDFTLGPSGGEFDPPGWNPNATTSISLEDPRWRQWARR